MIRSSPALLAAFVWSALLFYLSSVPGGASFLDRFPSGADKVVHAGAYLVLGGLLTLAFGRPRLAFLLALLYGASDEIHQLYVPGRHADLLDLLADAVGAAVGCAAVWHMQRRRSAAPVE